MLDLLLANSGLIATTPAASPGIRTFAEGVNSTYNITAAWDEVWRKVFDFDSGLMGGAPAGGIIFGAIADVGILFASFCLVYLTVTQVRNLFQEENYLQFGANLIGPVLLVILLRDNGEPLARLCFELRGWINDINQNFLQISIAGLDLQSVFQKSQDVLGFRALFSFQAGQCETLIGDEQSECLLRVVEVARQQVIDNGAQEGFFDFLEDAAIAAAAAGVTALVALIPGVGIAFAPTVGASTGLLLHFITEFESFAFTLMNALLQSYQHFLEMSFLTAAFFSPLAVGCALLPFGPNWPFLTWLSGFLSLGLAKLGLNIAIGLASLALVNQISPMGDMLPLYMFYGLAAPAISAAILTFGGFGIFQAFTGGIDAAAGIGKNTLKIIT